MSSKIHNPESHVQLWRGIDTDKSQELEETVEILQEQIETLQACLREKNHELQEIKQELSYTNHELNTAHEFCAEVCSKLSTIDSFELGGS